MALRVRRHESLPAGTTPTAANIDAVAGNRPNTVTTAGTGSAVITADAFYKGTRALRIGATATGFTWYTRDTQFGTRTLSVYCAIYFDVLPNAAIDFISFRDASGTFQTVGGLGTNASNAVAVKDKTAVKVTWSATPLQAQTWYLVKMTEVQDASPTTTNGTITASLTVGLDPNATPTQSYTSAACNLGTVLLDGVFAGKLGSGIYDLTLDDFVVNDSATALGPPAALPPVASAGPDQSVEPWTDSVQLDSSASTAEQGIATRGWAQVGASDVPPSNPAVTGPTVGPMPAAIADRVLKYRVTITDNLGQTATDDVDITVLKALDSAYTSSGRKPMRVRSY